jgi:PAS domain S-box-containing protein
MPAAAEPTSIAETRLALALEAAQLGTWTWDKASGITTWDVRLEELHGLGPGEFGGTFDDWLAAMHPDDRPECLARVQAALADPGPYLLLHRATWPDGSVHWVECRGRVLVGDDGEPSGTTGVAIDVTERERRRERVARELAAGREVVDTLQQALLPTWLPTVAGVEVSSRYVGATGEVGVGGDWFAVAPAGTGRLGIGIGDVAGHGLPAVTEMAETRFSLRALAVGQERPDEVLTRLNEVVSIFQPEPLITAMYGIVDPVNRTFTFASAGHYPPVLRVAGQGARLVDVRPQPPLGVPATYRTTEVHLPPGSTLVFYTDGLV